MVRLDEVVAKGNRRELVEGHESLEATESFDRVRLGSGIVVCKDRGAHGVKDYGGVHGRPQRAHRQRAQKKS